MRPAVRGVVAAAVLLGGAIAAATAPGSPGILAPFAVDGVPGEPVTSRQLVVEVLEVRAAEQVLPEYGGDPAMITTSGVWVVVDCIVTPRLGPEQLNHVELEIGERVFRTEDVLPFPNLSTLPYGAGIPVQGSLVFQIPRSALTDARASAARIVFHPRIDTRLDSVSVVVVDLTDLDVQPQADIAEPFVPDADE